MKLQDVLLIFLTECRATNTDQIHCALIQAAIGGNLGMVKQLIEAGIRDAKLIEGLSGGVGYASDRATKYGYWEIVKCLIDAGVKVCTMIIHFV